MSNDYFWRENSNKSFLVEFEFSRQNKEKNYNEIIQAFSRIFIVFYHKVN